MSVQDLRESILEAAAPLQIIGSGSRLSLLGRTAEQPLSTSAQNQIIAIEADEFVVTVQSGVKVHDLVAELKQVNLRLPFDMPFCGETSTVGGLVATNWTGSSRPFEGAVRDHVFGVKFLNAAGDEIKSGGTVVKNVTGYDLSKLLSGSFGRLGLITEVSMRLVPIPPLEQTLTFEASAAEAIAAMDRLLALPLGLTGLAWDSGVLSARLSGLKASVEERAQKTATAAALPLSQTLSEGDSTAHWVPLNPDTGTGWRLSIPRDQASKLCTRASRLDWGGALVWSDQIELAEIHALKGHGIHFGAGLSHDMTSLDILAKRALDPHGRFADPIDGVS